MSSEPRLGFANELPCGAVEPLRQPEHGVQAGVSQPSLEETHIRRMAGSFGRQGFLRHSGL